MGRLKVSRAEYAGACYGVQRALDLTLETANADKTVCTLGPLIHNPQVVSDLAARGIRVADAVEDCTEQAVVIRSHGVVPEVLDALAAPRKRDRGCHLPSRDARTTRGSETCCRRLSCARGG